MGNWLSVNKSDKKPVKKAIRKNPSEEDILGELNNLFIPDLSQMIYEYSLALNVWFTEKRNL